jgi:hypothetical protein
MKKTTITIILILICTFSYGQETKIFKKDNISFEYPVEWINRDFPSFYILVSEPPKEKMSVMTTFDVAVEKDYKSLKEFCDSYENKMLTNEQFNDFKIKTKNKIDYKGMKATEYNCTANVSYLPIEWKSIIFMNDGKIYKLSTTSMIGQFYLIKETTEKIFDSFKIE